MDLIHLMIVFVAVGEEESLAAAARRLDLSSAAVNRAIGALEGRLGVTLLERLGRTVRLTEPGRHQLASMQAILRSLAAADQAVSSDNSAHGGRLSVTASVIFGRMFVLPCIAQYMAQCPRLEVAACFVDRPVNLVDEGQDVAVRIGRLPDSGLKAVTVGLARRVLCAAPAYLAERGVPRRPADLVRHALIARQGDAAPLEASVCARLRPRLAVTGAQAAIEAALAGLGIASAMHYQVDREVREGRLAIVLADCESAPLPVQVLHRQGRYGALKVRNFIDLLVGRLRQEACLH